MAPVADNEVAVVDNNIDLLYTSVFTQVHALEEDLYIAGTSFGDLLVYDIKSSLDCEENWTPVEDRPSLPMKRVKASKKAVYSAICANNNTLISGSDGGIKGWKIKDLKHKENGKIKNSWEIEIHEQEPQYGPRSEVNSLCEDAVQQHVWAACGDLKTRIYDLNTLKLVGEVGGHQEYVHQVVVRGQMAATCSEDGTVLVWDRRAPLKPTHSLTPHTNPKLARPGLGKYIRSVDLCSSEWLVCGGGPRTGVYHLGSGEVTAVLPPNDCPVTVAKFTYPHTAANIITAGMDGGVRIWSLSGKMMSELPSSVPQIWSVELSTKPSTLLTIAGSGRKIDVCLNLNYRDHQLYTDFGHLAETS